MTDQADLSITHRAQGQGGKYVATLAGESSHGYLEWEQRKDLPKEQVASPVRVATHTIVPEAIGGRGVAAQLVERRVEDARRLGFKIDPQCSYVAAKFDKNPDWASLRA